MADRNNLVIMIIVIAVCILLMVIAAFLFLKKSDSEEGGKGVAKKPTKKRRPHSQGRPRPSHRTGTHAGKKHLSHTPIKALKDERTAEEYAGYIKEYLKTHGDTSISISGAKKYYSEQRGMECVEVSYSIKKGLPPAAFRAQLNDMDTALSNISGRDTVTYHADSTPEGSYRTTFYLT